MADDDDRTSEPLDSDLDAEGEEADDDYPTYGPEISATVKSVTKPEQENDSEVDAEGEDDEDAVGTTDDEEDADSQSSSESEDNAWQEEIEASGEEAEDDKLTEANRCMFCGETEDNDPSEEYEEYLECSACRDNAHRQCARDNGALDDDEEAKNWKCRTCTEQDVEADDDTESQTRDSAPQLPNELLPTIADPDSHSVFDSLIVDDDPLDGTRSLRKRKPSEPEPPLRDLRKRRRQSDVLSASGAADRSLSPDAATPANGEDGNTRPIRLRRPKKADNPLVSVVSSEGISLIVAFNLDRGRMQKILSSRPRKNRYKEKNKKKIPVAQLAEPEPSHYPAIQSSYNSQFYGILDREGEEKTKPYGGILTEAEADTSKTFPQIVDRKRFEDARLSAEEDWKNKMAATNNIPEPTKPSQKMSGPPSKIKCINFGGFEIDTWNAAPYPEEYSRNKILYICEFCLKYMNSDYVAWRHKLKCPAQHPPGDEIYRDGKYSFFEVDGRKNPVYCQNLCLLAKLFLGSKTLYYDVEPFLFYVMTENDDLGCHFVGYFSKEKRPSSMNNVSCILVLPIYQRRGFGHMLIEFSYLLTKKEQKTGSPEKPLSDMGLVSYRGYWRLMMCYQLVNQKGAIGITELAKQTGMTPDDVISALEGLRALVRDPITRTYALRLDYAFFKDYIEKYERKSYPRINPESLMWTKYLMNRGLSMHYEGGGPLHTVAPREEEEDDDDEMDVDQGTPPEGGQEAEMLAMANGDTDMLLDGREEAHVNGVEAEVDSPASRPSTPTRAKGRTVGDGTATPVNNAVSTIPLSRFEVFPHVPGMTGRKRGRPPGSRRRPETPQSNSAIKSNTVTSALFHNGSPSLRRTRSGLGEAGALNGTGETETENKAGHSADNLSQETASLPNGVHDEDMDAEGEDE